MKPHSFSSFAKQLAIIIGVVTLASPLLANEQKIDVWYDSDGNPRRVTVVQANGTTTLVEIDTEKPKAWRQQLKALGVDMSVFGQETLPDTEQLGNAHQLMQYRGFDRSSLPDSTYFSNAWGYCRGFGYPVYRYPRGGGHFCRPHHPRGGGFIFTF